MFYGSKHERSIAKWLGSLVVSILAHGGLGLAVVTGSVDRAPLKYISRDVDVTLSVPRLSPSPPALHGVRPQRTTPSTTPKARRRVLLQPTRMPALDKLAAPAVTHDFDDDFGGGVEGGVIGGVVGGTVGGDVGGQFAAPEGPPVLLGAGMTRPLPTGECSPSGARPKPITPEQARRMSITGTVLVEYTVHSDGRVGEISIRNDGPSILFDAVRKWLEKCSFSPSLSGTRPIPVRVIQPFVFQMNG